MSVERAICAMSVGSVVGIYRLEFSEQCVVTVLCAVVTAGDPSALAAVKAMDERQGYQRTITGDRQCGVRSRPRDRHDRFPGARPDRLAPAEIVSSRSCRGLNLLADNGGRWTDREADPQAPAARVLAASAHERDSVGGKRRRDLALLVPAIRREPIATVERRSKLRTVSGWTGR